MRLGYIKRHLLVRGLDSLFGPAAYGCLLLAGMSHSRLTLLLGDVENPQKLSDHVFFPPFILVSVIGLWQP